jgi:glycosyltransferase involved in cell wall biosynthesis
MVAQPSLEKELSVYGIGNFRRWSRGVDLKLFRPRPKTFQYSRPIMLYAGRVSKEKNLETFLSIRTPGTKVIVGDGPIRAQLARDYPDAVFLGYRKGEALAEAYANADVFVFPSRTDTFGLVIIEALACGVPVAAYPVVGPIDIVTRPDVGALSENLGAAITLALLNGKAQACVEHASTFTWERCTEQLASNFVPIK